MHVHFLSSQFGQFHGSFVLYPGASFPQIFLRWGLLADRYGLPIRDYWQTVHKISKRSAEILLLADPWCLVQKSNCYRTVKKLRQRASACHLRPVTFPQVPGG